MNFRKSSEGGEGYFQSKNLYCKLRILIQNSSSIFTFRPLSLSVTSTCLFYSFWASMPVQHTWLKWCTWWFGWRILLIEMAESSLFCIFCGKKVRRLEKSMPTPLPTNISYAAVQIIFNHGQGIRFSLGFLLHFQDFCFELWFIEELSFHVTS